MSDRPVPDGGGPAILITGGTSGIGRATAEVLHTRGWRVAVTGSSDASVEHARASLPEGIVALAADSRSLADADRVASEIHSRFDALDAVFLNAGVTASSPIADVDERMWDEQFATNAKGAFFTLQRMLPLLRDGGSVVVTVGMGAVRGVPGSSVTAGSRAALLGMVPSLALELAPRRIRVNAVSPGVVDTPIWARRGISEQRLAQLAERIPLGRLGVADDIASAVAFLVSDESTWITGENLVVGGGAGLGA